MRFTSGKILKLVCAYILSVILLNLFIHMGPFQGFRYWYHESSPIKNGILSVGIYGLNLNATDIVKSYKNSSSNGQLKDINIDKASKHGDQNSNIYDAFISVKTTAKYHVSRVSLILETWWIFARDQTYFFTDEHDQDLYEKTRGHLINTNCTSSHARTSLCCKMSVEYDHFILSNKSWWCHVDDDTYLNIPALNILLRNYSATRDWYLGRPSLTHPIELRNPSSQLVGLKFWFATGGAGFCMSRPLALKMMSHIGGGRLKSTCAITRLPDDCTIGYIVEHVAKSKLTVIRQFHSHLEGLNKIKQSELANQISLSYGFNQMKNTWNVVMVNGFSEQDDPTRLRSIHCHLFPYLKQCPDDIFAVQ